MGDFEGLQAHLKEGEDLARAVDEDQHPSPSIWISCEELSLPNHRQTRIPSATLPRAKITDFTWHPLNEGLFSVRTSFQAVNRVTVSRLSGWPHTLSSSHGFRPSHRSQSSCFGNNCTQSSMVVARGGSGACFRACRSRHRATRSADVIAFSPIGGLPILI